MRRKIIANISILFFLSSCSTRLSDYFSTVEETGDRNNALIKSFEVEDNVLEKFKEKKEENKTIITKNNKRITVKSKTT